MPLEPGSSIYFPALHFALWCEIEIEFENHLFFCVHVTRTCKIFFQPGVVINCLINTVMRLRLTVISDILKYPIHFINYANQMNLHSTVQQINIQPSTFRK